jgi:AcrR family transcriptional regulator
MPPRAPSLKPEERRKAILRATLPLIREQGLDISTAEMARAAGVAEGTLFRAFTSKQEIIYAVIELVMDPADSIDALNAIDRTLPLPDRLVAAVRISHARIHEISRLMSALHASAESHVHPAKLRDRQAEHTRVMVEAMAGVLAPDTDRLRLTPAQTASLLRSLAFATSHPFLSDGMVTDPETIVDVFLRGVLKEER